MHVEETVVEEGGQESTQDPSYKYPELHYVHT